jgi:type II secretory pathway pseudopilin PulG
VGDTSRGKSSRFGSSVLMGVRNRHEVQPEETQSLSGTTEQFPKLQLSGQCINRTIDALATAGTHAAYTWPTTDSKENESADKPVKEATGWGRRAAQRPTDRETQIKQQAQQLDTEDALQTKTLLSFLLLMSRR